MQWSMTFVHLLAGLALVVGSCAAIAAAATLWMIGMARLEQAAIRVEPDREQPFGRPAPRRHP